MKLRYVSAAAVVALLLPFAASALSVSELTAQIQALLAQVAALQQQLKTLQSTPTTSPGTPENICPALSRTLSSGASGPDVLSLQQFLVAQNLLSAEAATGSFESRTETAVQRLQERYGIVRSGTPTTTGYGMVGPRTRSLIALNCSASPSCPVAPRPTAACSAGWQANTDANGCTTSYRCSTPLPSTPVTGACTAIALLCPSGTHDEVGPNCSHSCVAGTRQSSVLFATPTTGQVPLLVTFTLSATDSTDSSGVYYTIDFGDGQATSFARTAAPSLLHTYASAGTFTATVTRRSNCSSWECLGSATVVGTATIIVSGVGGTPPFSISSPTSGQSVRQGEVLTVVWDSQNAPAGSAAAFWLVKSSGATVGLIARNQLVNGTFGWQVPGPQCNSSGVCIAVADSPSVHYADAGTYWVVGKIYSPVDAHLGGFPPANPITPKFLATATSSLFNILGSQSSSCAADVSASQTFAQGQICGQGGSTVRCPYDSSYVVNVLNTCSQGYLQSRGWTAVQ